MGYGNTARKHVQTYSTTHSGEKKSIYKHTKESFSIFAVLQIDNKPLKTPPQIKLHMPHEYNITSTAKYLISVLLLSIILSVSALTVTYFLYRMEIELRDTEMWNFIYDTGCYQDAEPQKLLWFTAISIVFYLLMNLFFHCISYLYKP